MTDDEVKEFFNQVKGKKIRLSYWGQDEYFIPERLEGGIMHGIDENGISTSDFVLVGFDINYCVNCWQFVDDTPITTRQQNGICTCDIKDLMIRGCKCGGK